MSKKSPKQIENDRNGQQNHQTSNEEEQFYYDQQLAAENQEQINELQNQSQNKLQKESGSSSQTQPLKNSKNPSNSGPNSSNDKNGNLKGSNAQRNKKESLQQNTSNMARDDAIIYDSGENGNSGDNQDFQDQQLIENGYSNIMNNNIDENDDQIDQEELEEQALQEQILPNSQPPRVPEDGTYIDALNEAGIDPKRIQQLQDNVNEDGNGDEGDEFNIWRQYSNKEIENFRCIFEMFDKQYTGFVKTNDLQIIMKKLGRDPQEAIDLLEEMDFDPNGLLSFEEFLKIMKNLENRLVASKQEELNSNAQGPNANMIDANGDIGQTEGTFEERNKYGCLLPRTGVHFLPDSKVVDFLRLLNDYRKKCCKEMNLTEARRAALKFEDLKNKEMLRQLQNMKQAQEQELITVESAQRAQFLEFSSAWDNYMSDYEATAYLSLEKLKEKHLLEIQQLHEKIRKDFSQKITFTKELMDMRKKVQKLLHSKRYEEAEELNNQSNLKEQQERDGQETQIEQIIEQNESRLRRKQQMALAALLKRIQRDRNEQLKHRQIDSQRLIQRNKNLLLDLLNKQNMETRRTNQFLRFALGARSDDKKKYYKSKLFYDPNEAKLPMSQQLPQRNTKYPAGPNSSSLRALQNHRISREGGNRSFKQNTSNQFNNGGMQEVAFMQKNQNY